MNCHACGGRLEGLMTYCPFCRVRQEVDLSQVNHRNLGPRPDLRCPSCAQTLEGEELRLPEPLEIDRCPGCHGLFFNPGELEAFLARQVAQLTWLDQQKLVELEHEAAEHHQATPVAARFYRPCPACQEPMVRENFGGRSSVMIDRCGQHGVWLDHGELRRLAEWWHAGGEHHFNADQQRRALAQRYLPRPIIPRPGAAIDPYDKALPDLQRRRDGSWTDGPRDLAESIGGNFAFEAIARGSWALITTIVDS